MHRHVRNVAMAAALLVTVALTVSGCGASTGPSAGKHDLTLALTSGPASLDPNGAANSNASEWYIDLAYQSLISQDKDGNLAPALAASWKFVDADHKQFEVTLQSGLKFADGSTLNADAVVASIEHFKTGKGPVAQNWRDIKVAADGEDKVRFTSAEPDALLPVLLTPKYMAGAIISPAGLANPDAIKSATFGAGPYVLDTANTVAGDHYVYTPNKNYYDQDQVKFDKVTVKVIPNLTSELQALKTGQIDVMLGDQSIMAGVKGSANITTLTQPVFENGIVFLDRNGTIAPALADVRVRQALNYAVDRAAITKAVYGEYGTPESQPATPGDPSFGYDPSLTNYYPYDPAKAKELLTEAGYLDGFEFNVAYKGQQAASVTMVQAIAAQLAKIGVKVTLVPAANTGEWAAKLATKTVAAAQQDSSGKPRLLELPGYLLPGGSLNQFSIVDPELQTAFDQLVKAGEDTDGTAAKNITKIMVEQAITMPIAQVDEIILYNSSKVKNITYLGNTPKLSYVESWAPADGK